MTTEKNNDIVLFNRKSHLTFSIEELFHTLLQEFSASDVGVNVAESSFDNNSWFNRWRICKAYTNLNGQVIHVTGEITFANLLSSRKNIVTFHDVEVLKRNKGIKKWLLNKIWYQWPANKANIITVVSEETKRELLSEIDVSESKIKVIPNPISPDINPRPLPNNKKKQILAIGTKGNKNLERLIEACHGLSVKLHVIGKLKEHQLQKLLLHNIDYTNDYGLEYEQVIQHYYNSDLVAFVSTYEGFGLPIIEAQAAGRPVLSSDVSSMPEVAGAGALLIDPFDVESIRKGIKRLVEDEELRQDLVRKGLLNVKRFQPKEIANQYIHIYNQLLNEQ